MMKIANILCIDKETKTWHLDPEHPDGYDFQPSDGSNLYKFGEVLDSDITHNGKVITSFSENSEKILSLLRGLPPVPPNENSPAHNSNPQPYFVRVSMPRPRDRVTISVPTKPEAEELYKAFSDMITNHFVDLITRGK